MNLSEDELTISKKLSALDEEVVAFTNVLGEHGVEYVIVSGYVAILTGRSRSTEDIDVVLEPLSQQETEELAQSLKKQGYWGMAMPLDSMYDMLERGDRMRVAEEGEMIPNFEIWFGKNSVEIEALENSILATFGGVEIAISPIELQIAYKLLLAQSADSTTGKDFEDALHLFLTFEEQLNRETLQAYVTEFGVEEYYDELQSI